MREWVDGCMGVWVKLDEKKPAHIAGLFSLANTYFHDGEVECLLQFNPFTHSPINHYSIPAKSISARLINTGSL